MDGKGEVKGSERSGFGRSGPAWRTWLLSIVAAVVLWAAATLMLAGSFRLPGGSSTATGERVSVSSGPRCPVHGEGRR